MPSSSARLLKLKTVRAYLLKEELRKLWGHFSITLAGAFLLDWCRAAKVARGRWPVVFVPATRRGSTQPTAWPEPTDR